MKEPDLGYNLDHTHIVKLFGACHLNQPFFVSEETMHSHLCDYLSKVQS